jgi:hypothetical protein
MKINNLAGLRRETERLEYKLKVDKSKLKTDFQLLRFQILGYALKEVIGLFRRSPSDKEETIPEKEQSAKE